jgi:hypothetical protein
MPLLNEADAVYVGTELTDVVVVDAAQVWLPTYSAMQLSEIFTALQVVSTR